VSDATRNLLEIYDDIDLCYKVMGLTFSDPPDKVDKVYNGLVAEYTKSMQSTDPADRQAAKDNLEQTRELYERITGSMIYKDYAREYEKYKLLKAEEMDARKQKNEAEKESMVNCPYCNKKIPAKLRLCMYCHRKILTPFELIMHKFFSKRNIIIVAVVVVVLAVGAVLMLNPHLFR
jgi:DNA-directed RNA polymerase subunit RPC12/RpoP